MNSERYAIGQIVKTRGLKGELLVEPLTNDPQRFLTLKEVWIEQKVFQVVEAHVQGRRVHVRLTNVKNREGAEKLVGKFLLVTEENRVRLPEGSYFIHEILGSSVMNERGKKIGTVSEVLKLPANDVYVVRNGSRELLIPAVRSFIEKIDTKKKEIQIHMIEGL